MRLTEILKLQSSGRLVKNKIYTVRDVGPHLTLKGTVAILLEEIINPR